MQLNHVVAAIFIGATVWTSAAIAGPSDPIGSAVRIVNRVTAEADQSARNLAQGDGVKQNEVISVEADSLGELRLNDETKLALGPGAKLKLDKFVYDPDKATGAIAVDITKGAFRFITGLAKKPSYLIRSPSASISVRGTILDVYVEANGTMWVLLHEGSIEVCNAAKQCKTIKDPCGIVRVGAGGDLSDAATWNRQPAVREIDFETAFPFVVRPPQIDPSPRFTRVAIEAGSCVADQIPTPPTRRAEAPQSTPSTSEASKPSETQAEDIPGSAYTAPTGVVAQAAARSWTGFYAGVSLGGGWGPGDTDVSCDDPNSIVDTTAPDCQLSLATGGLESNYDLEPSGWLGGVQAGYNVQTSKMVAGMEIDITRSSIEGSDSASGNLFNGSFGQRRLTQELEWFGTVRGRLGFVTGDMLLYGTAGLAYGKSTFRYVGDYLAADDAIADQTKSIWSVGWTVGAGAELGMGVWSLKGEYLYFDLGEEKFGAQLVFSGVPNPVYFRPEFETRGHIFRFGINYQID